MCNDCHTMQAAPLPSSPTCVKNIQEAPVRKVQKNKSRCFVCRKKINLTAIQCRCSYFYCTEHRYPEQHECDFDFKKDGRDRIAKANPVVVGAKLQKI